MNDVLLKKSFFDHSVNYEHAMYSFDVLQVIRLYTYVVYI